jgi:uncharacterized protein
MKNKMIFVFFTLVTILLLFAVHFLFYDYLVRFFSIQNPALKRSVAITIYCLPILFILSMILLHFFNNAVVSALYFISGLWVGILVNFLVVIVGSWFLVGVFKVLHQTPNSFALFIIGIIGTAIALGLSVYGVYNVYHVKINSHKVSIENLPVEWKGKKFVQLSDVHLGSVLGNDYFDKINKDISDIKPDIILITGDLFDGTDKDLDGFIPELKKISAPMGVFYSTGNHDTYIGSGKVKDVVSKTGIRLLDNELVMIDGVQIVGVSYPERLEDINISEKIKSIPGYDPLKPAILSYHEPIQIQSIKDAGVDLMLSGHTHKGQLWPLNYITEQLFKGFDYGFFHWDNFTLYVSCGAGVWGPTMRTSGHDEITVFTLE